MPQLDPSSFPSQLFWLTVSFVALYVLMARFLLPRIQEVIEAREARITGDLDRSEKLRAEAETAKNAYEKALAEARTASQALFVQADAQMAEKSASQQAALDAKLMRQIADAEASILTAKQDALTKMTPVAGELAAMIVEKVMHRKPTADAIAATVKALSKQGQV